MSSRVGTAIPASRSTARSSAALGLTRSIQTALSGNLARSSGAAFFSEDSAGTNTDNMEHSATGHAKPTQQDLARFWQALHDRRTNRRSIFVAAGWRQGGIDSAAAARLPKNEPKSEGFAAKKTQPGCRNAGSESKVWNYG